MKGLRVLIIDDEPLARARLRDLLKADSDIAEIKEYADGFEAVISIQELSADLVFLDVQMPERDGFEVVAEIGVDKMPVVVFVTAYDQYALRAFEVHAFDYLLKPFDDRRFAQTLERAKEQIHSAKDSDIRHRMLSLINEWQARQNYLQRILLKAGDRISFLKTDDIDWIKAEGNYVRLHARGDSYLLRERLNNIETQLDPQKFLRIHRSTIVNLDRVSEIRQMFHGKHRVVLQDGTHLTLSRRYREKLPRFTEKCS